MASAHSSNGTTTNNNSMLIMNTAAHVNLASKVSPGNFSDNNPAENLSDEVNEVPWAINVVSVAVSVFILLANLSIFIYLFRLRDKALRHRFEMFLFLSVSDTMMGLSFLFAFVLRSFITIPVICATILSLMEAGLTASLFQTFYICLDRFIIVNFSIGANIRQRWNKNNLRMKVFLGSSGAIVVYYSSIKFNAPGSIQTCSLSSVYADYDDFFMKINVFLVLLPLFIFIWTLYGLTVISLINKIRNGIKVRPTAQNKDDGGECSKSVRQNEGKIRKIPDNDNLNVETTYKEMYSETDQARKTVDIGTENTQHEQERNKQDIEVKHIHIPCVQGTQSVYSIALNVKEHASQRTKRMSQDTSENKTPQVREPKTKETKHMSPCAAERNELMEKEQKFQGTDNMLSCAAEHCAQKGKEHKSGATKAASFDEAKQSGPQEKGYNLEHTDQKTTRIGKYLRSSSQRKNDFKVRAIKQIGIIILVLTFTSGIGIAVQVYEALCPTCAISRGLRLLSVAGWALNSALNPVVNFCMIREFRTSFIKTLKCQN